MRLFSRRLALALLLSLLALPTASFAAKPKPAPDHWVGTWAAAPLGIPAANPNAPPNTLILGTSDLTLRQIVHTSLGTAKDAPLVRIELSNALGTDPLTIGAAHIALAAPAPTSGPATPTGDIALATANALTFNGASTITIPPGGEAISDPAALTLPAGSDLVISIFIPAQTLTTLTVHSSAFQTNFLAPGNVVGQRTLTSPQPLQSWFFLRSVDVKLPADSAAVVALGDSITDGSNTTPNTNQRWPDFLARRLQSDKRTQHLAVLDQGIGGNRILHEGWGPSAAARFNRDVLAMPGVRYLILLEGINDLGNAYSPKDPHDIVTADDLIAGLAQLAERAHAHNIKVFGATLTPYMGCGYSSPAGEAVRQQLNTWIRTTRLLDGVIDFDKATQSPTAPDTFNPAYDSGDRLHPNDAGMKAMANSIDLKLFIPAP